MRGRRIRPGKTKSDPRGWLGHLEDLRLLLLKSLFSWLLASLLLFIWADVLLEWARLPLLWAFPASGEAPDLLALTPVGPFLVTLRLSLGAGLLLAAPFILAWAILFLLPALHPRERRLLWPLLGSGLVLFGMGMLFAFRVVLPPVIRFFADYARNLQVRPFWGLSDYVSLVIRLLGAFGLAFEFPVVILGLSALGIVDRTRLVSARPYVVVAVLVLAALLTPPDVISQLFLALPLLLLFEICVFLSRFITARNTGMIGLGKGTGTDPGN